MPPETWNNAASETRCARCVAAIGRTKQRDAVLEAFDQLAHTDKQAQREKASEVRRKARSQF
ncbi:hypothetical protein KTE68_14075 [Burkholderia multivorans]|nr:hypothetical protein [Burkholderia multivorans]